MSTNSTDPLIGRLIDGRYQVRSRIARGGMATVYLATDLRLERRVAIKIMHGHLADDTQYKARFIQEARSAARLAHPNVVNVYDQGQDDETAYLVMEYLPGITLRDLLNEHPILTTDQTMDIMEALLSGLAAAHRNGIVHRDLKPENILLADDGRIKISDFGLARAATAQTATGNALLGTIAYLSPELVTRGVADARSDIYAVGIMLYEMLAGEQPYKGEQPFQIAQQHANDTVPTPSTKNPRVPAELDELVLWATARDPEQRPRDARAMLEQLHEAQHVLREGTSSPSVTVPIARTVVMPTDAAPTSETETQVLGTRQRRLSGPITFDSTTSLAASADRRRSRGRWIFTLVVLLAALAGATGWYFGTGPGSKVIIPDVTGKEVPAATDILRTADLTVATNTKEGFSATIGVGKVMGTDPTAGSSVAHGGSVTLIVSKGPKLIAMPALVGMSENAALALIKDSFVPTESTYQFDGKVANGVVIGAWGLDREGKPIDLAIVTEYWQGQPVTLIVSLGSIPDVAGMSVDDAKKALSDRDLVGSTSDGLHDWSDTVSKGDVVGYKPLPSGTATTKGTVLQLIISDGFEQVTIPDLVGKTWKEAKPKLIALGFTLDYNTIADSFPLSTVKKISLAADSEKSAVGKTVDKGTKLHISFNLSF